MILVDTHTHLYLEQFDSDRNEAIQRAIDAGVSYMFIPGIDSDSAKKMLALCDQFPENCFPMIGLHPSYVKENYEEELQFIEKSLQQRAFSAIGETGTDLYWDKSFVESQEVSFRQHIEWAIQYKLPIVVHSREAFPETFKILDEYKGEQDLKGVFHCYSGNTEQAKKIIEDYGFLLGIGGVVTYKNSGLVAVVENIDLKHIVLETDAPFLPPVPFRGKRNESAYVVNIAEKIAQIKGVDIKEVAEITTANAMELFWNNATMQ